MSVTVLDVIHNTSLEGLMVVLTSSLVALLSVIIFWQDTAKRSNLFFLFFGLVVGLWGAAYIFFNATLSTPVADSSLMILYLALAAIPLSVFMYLYSFANEKNPATFKNLFLQVIPYLLIAALIFFIPGFIVGYKDATLGGVAEGVIFGQGYPLYLVYFFGFLIGAILLLVKKYHASTGVFKITIRNLAIALFAACVIVFSAAFIVPLYKLELNLFFIGHVSVVVLGFVIAYIVSKYNFWSINVIATEFFISIITMVLVFELFLATSALDLLVKAGITILIILSSSFLVASVRREAQSREKINRLVYDLDIMSKELKVLDKKKSEFLAIASHHLRDPLTAIKGYSSMLVEGSFGELPLGVMEATNKIFESSKHLITMVSDFLDISRIESGDMNYNFTDVDVRKIVLDIEPEARASAEKAHITVNVTVDDRAGSTPFITVGDTGKLKQVVSNLIDNAIKYTPRGEVSVLLSKSTDGKKILFSVSDTGIGMSESTLEKIFRKFSRAEEGSKVYTEGVGLGLYVAKEIIGKHEGRIWAESKGEGLGSTLYVELEAKQ